MLERTVNGENETVCPVRSTERPRSGQKSGFGRLLLSGRVILPDWRRGTWINTSAYTSNSDGMSRSGR